MKIGYARVSTLDQNLDRQIKDLREHQCEKIFSDKASGATIDRPDFLKMLNFAREKDIIVFQELNRLGRNYDEIKQVITLLKEKGVGIEIIDAPFLNFDTGNATLDKAMFDMMISFLGYIAENERKKILERQQQGIAIAKQKGVYKGKSLEYSAEAKDPKKRAIYQLIITDLQNNVPIMTISKKYGVSRNLIYRIKNEYQ